MNQEILNFFMKKGFLLDKEMLGFFGQLEDKDVVDGILHKIQGSG